MSEKLKACVVGAGSGGKLSMTALTKSVRYELIAVADISHDARVAARAAYDGVRTYPDHREMFAAVRPDVVCVSTWPPSHEEITLDALKLPLRGIVVEKPLAHTAESARRLLAAIKKHKLPMAVPHNLMVKRTPLEIIERVRRGDIGELKLVEIQCHRWDIINAGIHWLQWTVNLLGDDRPAWVLAACDASTRTWRDGMQVETEAVTYAQSVSGVRVVMHTGDDVRIARQGKGTLFRVVGTGGLIEFWGWENGYMLTDAAHPGGELIAPEEYPVTGHQRQLENLAEMIDAGRCDYTMAETSLTALELCEGAYISNRHRCKVTLPLEGFTPPPLPDWDPGRPYSGSGGGRDGRKL